MTQDDLFFASEGDRWFERNRRWLQRPASWDDAALRLVELYGLAPRRVLEVGSANGYRLAAIQQRNGAEAVGIDVSPAAIRDGESRFPGLRFLRGRADALPLEETFDLVIVNFLLHWVGRSRLVPALAEIDRVLERSGFLILGDFLPGGASRNAYHHLGDAHVYTYKQDYAQPLLTTGTYELIALLTGDHVRGTPAISESSDERTGTWLLRKDWPDNRPVASQL